MQVLRMGEDWRLRMFWIGVIFAGLACVATLLTWAAPMPLIRVGDGLQDVNSYSFFVAWPCSLIAVVLGSYGRGRPRVLVVSSGVLTFVLAYLGLLSQGQ